MRRILVLEVHLQTFKCAIRFTLYSLNCVTQFTLAQTIIMDFFTKA